MQQTAKKLSRVNKHALQGLRHSRQQHMTGDEHLWNVPLSACNEGLPACPAGFKCRVETQQTALAAHETDEELL
jgi:hypothetical protein